MAVAGSSGLAASTRGAQRFVPPDVRGVEGVGGPVSEKVPAPYLADGRPIGPLMSPPTGFGIGKGGSGKPVSSSLIP